MGNLRVRRLTLAIGAILAAKGAQAVEYMPLYNVDFMGGQYFFSGAKSNLNGNAMANVTPVMRFSDRWSLLPTLNASFQGTKQVTDPVGSGTLFQQAIDSRLSFTGLYTPPESNWKLKPTASYKKELLKETLDEQWGKGLFDYNKYGVGFEAENTYKDPFSYRLGYDFFYVNFPNYKSLESQSGVDPFGNPLGRQTAGTHVLDTLNQQVSASVSRPYPYDDPKMSLQATYSLLWQMFPDQPIIDAAGQPMSGKRQDFVQSLGLNASYPRVVFGDYRLVSRFGVGLSYDGSNQNAYDAANIQYISDDYSYYSLMAGPSWTMTWGEERLPNSASMGFSYWHTQYLGRLSQNTDGSYSSQKQQSDRYLFSLGYAYPIAAHFHLKAQTNFLWQTSNMQYQALYRYTYRTANYLMGFTYDY